MIQPMVADQTTTVVFPKFGEFTYAESEIYEFPWGLPGFPHLRRFLALQLEEQPNFVWLQSVDDVNIALPTANPWVIFEDYEPKLPSYATSSLELDDPSGFTVLCVMIVTKNAEEMTMNLLAPIIVNLRTRKARQISLEGSDYSVRTPIPRKATALPAEGAVSG